MYTETQLIDQLELCEQQVGCLLMKSSVYQLIKSYGLQDGEQIGLSLQIVHKDEQMQRAGRMGICLAFLSHLYRDAKDAIQQFRKEMLAAFLAQDKSAIHISIEGSVLPNIFWSENNFLLFEIIKIAEIKSCKLEVSGRNFLALEKLLSNSQIQSLDIANLELTIQDDACNINFIKILTQSQITSLKMGGWLILDESTVAGNHIMPNILAMPSLKHLELRSLNFPEYGMPFFSDVCTQIEKSHLESLKITKSTVYATARYIELLQALLKKRSLKKLEFPVCNHEKSPNSDDAKLLIQAISESHISEIHMHEGDYTVDLSAAEWQQYAEKIKQNAKVLKVIGLPKNTAQVFMSAIAENESAVHPNKEKTTMSISPWDAYFKQLTDIIGDAIKKGHTNIQALSQFIEAQQLELFQKIKDFNLIIMGLQSQQKETKRLTQIGIYWATLVASGCTPEYYELRIIENAMNNRQIVLNISLHGLEAWQDHGFAYLAKAVEHIENNSMHITFYPSTMDIAKEINAKTSSLLKVLPKMRNIIALSLDFDACSNPFTKDEAQQLCSNIKASSITHLTMYHVQEKVEVSALKQFLKLIAERSLISFKATILLNPDKYIKTLCRYVDDSKLKVLDLHYSMAFNNKALVILFDSVGRSEIHDLTLSKLDEPIENKTWEVLKEKLKNNFTLCRVKQKINNEAAPISDMPIVIVNSLNRNCLIREISNAIESELPDLHQILVKPLQKLKQKLSENGYEEGAVYAARLIKQSLTSSLKIKVLDELCFLCINNEFELSRTNGASIQQAFLDVLVYMTDGSDRVIAFTSSEQSVIDRLLLEACGKRGFAEELCINTRLSYLITLLNMTVPEQAKAIFTYPLARLANHPNQDLQQTLEVIQSMESNSDLKSTLDDKSRILMQLIRHWRAQWAILNDQEKAIQSLACKPFSS